MAGATSTAGSIYVARFDYQAMDSDEFSFSKGEQLEISDTSGFWWKGRSLVSGDEGKIPRSFVQSMLELIQLLQFVMEEKVYLSILQTISHNSCSNDDAVSLFIKTIMNDPILLEALRQDKRQHEEEGKIVKDYCRVAVSIIMFCCFSLMFTQ